MKKVLFFIPCFLLLTLVGCDESASTDGAGNVYGDTTNSAATFGNLYKNYISKTSAYVEIKFSGTVGEEAGTGSNNFLMIPIWYGNSGHFYICLLTDSDLGTVDPDLGIYASYSDNGINNTYWSDAVKGTDVFSVSDKSEKTFGCELKVEAGLYKINAYLNGTKYASYTVGVLDGFDSANNTVLDPGIATAAYEGRAGFGLGQYWDSLKVTSFKLMSKKP